MYEYDEFLECFRWKKLQDWAFRKVTDGDPVLVEVMKLVYRVVYVMIKSYSLCYNKYKQSKRNEDFTKCGSKVFVHLVNLFFQNHDFTALVVSGLSPLLHLIRGTQ